MKICFYYYICSLILYQVSLILPDEKRKDLLDKYAKKILDDEDDIFLSTSPLLGEGLYYEKTKIEELISKYKFPSSYNFIQDTNATVYIKNQKHCGCCWAMASTTALAYRFHKKGIEVDLSPQHELSCYIHDCNRGNNLIDPQLTLVKNGTISEECLPFTSGDGIVNEKCPTNNTCKNPNITYKKYYGRNAYKISLEQENIYDVTAIIMDQLLTQGPMMTSMVFYEDFQNINSDEDCINKVYTYDGNSMNLGGHAVTIVGYGFQDNKYYWLVQNSWGKEACQGGFVKIEFGQVGVGSVSWAEPYLEEKEPGKLIKINFGNIDDFCNIEVFSNSNLDNFKSQLNIVYKHKEKNIEFDYICGVNKLINNDKKTINCYYENMNIESYKGIYEYYGFEVIGDKNNFVIDESFFNQKFDFYGNDKIHHFSYIFYSNFKYNYISETSNRIYFLYQPMSLDQDMPPILASVIYEQILSNCVRTNYSVEGFYIAYCDISEKEYDYFEKCEKADNDYRMLTRGLCGVNYYRNLITCKIDKNSYPIFRIKKFEILNVEEADFGFNIIHTSLTTKIEGNIENYSDEDNSFIIIVSLEIDHKNKTAYMDCDTGIPQKLEDNYKLKCQIFEESHVENYYVLPYYGVKNAEKPFEVAIKDIIKGEFEKSVSFAKFLTKSIGLFLLFILF